jgi:hypothetical protein
VSEAAATAVPERGWYDRVIAAMPLATVFVWLVFLYVWESWGHVTPWLFKDELQNADLQRAIAHSGRASVLGQAAYFESLYNYVVAPVWWIHDTHTAYAALKVVNSVVMTSALFPTYFLARTVVGKPAALFAATTAAAMPAFVYTSFVVEEPAAYPWAALCFFLIARALATRERGWIAVAGIAAFVAPLVRSELAAMIGVFALAAFFLWWTGSRASAWRTRWSTWDWVGAAMLGIGALIVFNAAVSAHSHEWLIATGYLRRRMIEYGLWAAGALTIGLGVFPVVAALTAMFRARGAPPRTPAERAFTAVFAGGIISFGWYTAIKAAFITLSLGRLVEERNLIYVTPLVLVAAATWLERPRVRLLALAGAAGFALYLILRTPYEMNYHYYADAPGLGILQSANRNLSWTPETAQHVLLAMLALSVCLVVAPQLAGSRRTLVQGIAASAAVLALAWNVTAQVSSASASNTFSNEFTSHIDAPLDWLDQALPGQRVLYLGQSISDQNGLQILEFWNRSIEHVWSLDGTAPPPTISPDLAQTDGRLFPSPPEGVRYVLVEPGVDVVGTTVATHWHNDAGTRKLWRVVRFAPPLRLAHSVLGLQPDAWATSPDGKQPAFSAYNRFATPGNAAGTAIVTISRLAWGGEGSADIPGHVTIEVGTLVKRAKQPALGRVTAVRRWVVHSHGLRRFHIPTPKPPFRIEVRVSPTFVEAELDPRLSDRRHLGAQVGYDFRP